MIEEFGVKEIASPFFVMIWSNTMGIFTSKDCEWAETNKLSTMVDSAWVPWGPVGPTSPCSPFGPGGPGGPVFPLGPWGPTGPGSPRSPLGPGGPGRSLGLVLKFWSTVRFHSPLVSDGFVGLYPVCFVVRTR